MVLFLPVKVYVTIIWYNAVPRNLFYTKSDAYQAPRSAQEMVRKCPDAKSIQKPSVAHKIACIFGAESTQDILSMEGFAQFFWKDHFWAFFCPFYPFWIYIAGNHKGHFFAYEKVWDQFLLWFWA